MNTFLHDRLCIFDTILCYRVLIIKINKSYTTFIMYVHERYINNPSRMHTASQKIARQHKEVFYELRCLCMQKAETPSPRINSQLAYYKNKLYLYGGQPIQKQPQRAVAFYSYDLDSHKWSLHFPKAFTNNLPKFNPKVNTVVGNKWFMLGIECQQSTQKQLATKIWRLNFDLMDWITVEQKGETVKQLEGGSLVSYQKNFLVYYGGYSYFQNMCNNNIYLFNVDSKTWYKCMGSYQHTIKSRFSASMVNLNSKIFLYGGYYKHADHLQYLDDFYQITLKLPSKGVHPQAYFRHISTCISPSPRAQHYLFAVDSNTICLFGGKNAQSNPQTELWSYHTITDEWMLFNRIQDTVNTREGSSVTMVGNTIFIFGGIEQKYGGKQRLCGDLWSLNLNYNRLYTSQQQIEKIHSVLNGEYSRNCKICYQKKHDFFKTYGGNFSSEIIDGAISSINFPYAAFGLLIDKSVALGATVINISVEGQQFNPQIYIEDNAKTLFNYEDLFYCLYGFEGNLNLIMSGSDKKIKKQIQRDNLLKQFGINLKIGALRLGKKFLFSSSNGEVIHIFLCFKQTIQNKEQYVYHEDETDKQVYMFHYYAIDANTKQLLNPKMQSSRQFIESRYKKQVKLVTASKAIKNTLFIFQTFLSSKQQPVSVSFQNNDILYGDRSQIDKLTSYGYNMHECIDVSLRAYLSLLYLRCQQVKINFGLKHSSTTIIPQPYLQKIDKACRTGHIIELQDVLQFDFKLIEIYWQRELRRNNQFFSNGLLIYSKNRLICRYRIQLGGLLPIMAKQVTALTNYMPFFGYAQLPQHIPVNLFKTGFSFNILIEKLFSRLKFVEQGFKKRQTLLQNTNRLSKNDRREKLADDHFLGNKKKSRRSQPNNTYYMELPIHIGKDKEKKVAEPTNMPFFIKQSNEENKSNQQRPNKKAEIDCQESSRLNIEKDKKEKLIQLIQSQQ